MEGDYLYTDKACQVVLDVKFAGIVKNYSASTFVAQAVAASWSELG
jgi:hypothetical protein